MTTGGENRKCRHRWRPYPKALAGSTLGRVKLMVFCWDCGEAKIAWYYVAAAAAARGPKGRAARKAVKK